MPPGPRTSLDRGVHFLKLPVGPAYGLGMWRNEKLCTQWKSRVIPFAIGRNTLQQDAWAERGLSVYSAIIVERGRARGLKLCNYQKKETTQGSSHLHRTAQLFLNFLIQHNKQTQCALKEDSPSGWIIAVCARHSAMLPAACWRDDLIGCTYSMLTEFWFI